MNGVNVLDRATVSLKELLEIHKVKVKADNAVTNYRLDRSYRPININMNMIPTLQQMQNVAGALKPNQVYTLQFPANLPRNLMQLSNGGYSTTIVAPGTNNEILGSATLYTIDSFPSSIMSIMASATQQYYLVDINMKLDDISKKADEVLDLLEADKYAELASEIAFVSETMANFDSISSNYEQRIATLVNMQQTKKTASQHMSFYLFQLDSNNEKMSDSLSPNEADKRFGNFEKESAYCQAAIQLYYMCTVLEIYLSQNYTDNYVKYLASDVEQKANDVRVKLNGYNSVLKSKIKSIRANGFGPFPTAQPAKEKYEKILEQFEQRDQSLSIYSMRKSIVSIIDNKAKPIDCVICPDGTAYIKTA